MTLKPPFVQGFPVAGGPAFGTIGNASLAWDADVYASVLKMTTTLTADRAITAGASFTAGQRLHVTRPEAVIGDFVMSVMGVASLNPGEWCEVTYDGSNWYTSAFGTTSRKGSFYVVEFYDTGNASERVSTLALTTAAGTSTRFPIYSVQIPDLQVGDLVIGWGEAQVTNDILHGDGLPAATANTLNGQLNVGVGHQLVMTADDPGATGWVPGVNTLSGSRLSQPVGHNITPGAHHGELRNVGGLEIVVASRNWVHFMAYVYNSAMQSGDTLTVDAGLGRLTVLHMRPSS